MGDLEKDINQMIYRLYGLGKEEVGTTKKIDNFVALDCNITPW